VQLPPDPTSAGRARAFVAESLREWGDPVDVAAIELATSEVVTNALRHAGSAVVLTIRRDGSRIRVEVADRSRRLPVANHAPPDATSGRGLDIVEAVTDAWGAEETADDGKLVWFTVGVGGATVGVVMGGDATHR
jgi:anti-sigma regulatory factor (Ser/Thr protein kinase)